MTKLTNKQLKFIDEYMIDLNGTQAAIRTGYSPKTAQEQASRLLSNVIISEEIKRRQKIAAEKAELTKDKIIERQNRRSKLVDEMLELASKEKLTADEQAKFARLMMVIKTADGNNSDKILNEMLGFNEVKKLQIKTEFEIGIPGLTLNDEDGEEGEHTEGED